MRRIVWLSVALLLMAAPTVIAAPRAQIVTGGYSYEYLSHVSTVEVAGREGDPVHGWFAYRGEFATFSGPVACVRVDGADGWLAGPITQGDPGIEGVDAWAILVHDGGTPGRIGDTAITFLDTLEGALAFCASATHDFDGYLQPVTVGNLAVHADVTDR
jgi:hypothetical protein